MRERLLHHAVTVTLQLETAVLRRIEDEEEHARLGHVPRDRVGGRVLAGQKRFARVVVQAEDSRQLIDLFRAGMTGLWLHRKQEGPRITHGLRAEGHRVIEVALLFRLTDQAAERNKALGGAAGEERLFIVVQVPIGGRIRVGESDRKRQGERSAEFPGHRGQEERFAAGWRAEDRKEERLHFQETDGTLRWHLGQASEWQGEPFPSMASPRDGKPRGQDPLLMLGAEPRIAQQIGMLGDPQNAFRRELLPAMGAGDSSQNPPHGRRAGVPARLAL